MMRRHLIYGALILALARVAPVQASERDAVLWLDGCTGFVVDGDLLVTARHCRFGDTVRVDVHNQSVSAQRLYAAPGSDGPDVFWLDKGPYPSLPVAPEKPATGDRVYSLGYPGGNWARIEGEIVGSNGRDVNWTNHRIAGGNSGGPLLNAKGEVVGVALCVAADLNVHQSGFAGWSVTTAAVREAQRVKETGERQQKMEVVVFSSPTCGPCRALKQDVKNGHFDRYDFVFVEWDAKTKTWSRPELFREFVDTAGPHLDELAFPTIWVRGTASYRQGYESRRRGGLLQWLASLFKSLVEGIIGRPEPSPEPMPLPDGGDVELGAPDAGGPDVGAPELSVPNVGPPASDAPSASPEAESETQRTLHRLQADLLTLKDQALQTKSDFETFRASGVIGKIRSIARLKTDKDDALASVNSVRQDLAAVKRRFHEDPLQLLWGLFGIVSGLLHRRFAH